MMERALKRGGGGGRRRIILIITRIGGICRGEKASGRGGSFTDNRIFLILLSKSYDKGERRDGTLLETTMAV